jgi:hypothetical protein
MVETTQTINRCMGVKCMVNSDCSKEDALQCRNYICKEKPEFALAAVIIASVASILIGFSIGYLV